jgi:hypothetical protein
VSAVVAVPGGLQESGAQLWASVVDTYELDQHETALLTEACRVADRLHALAAAMGTDLLVTNYRGDQVTNPLLVEARLQGITLSRLLASLRLPSGEEDTRPQRRGSSRGSYGVRAAK